MTYTPLIPPKGYPMFKDMKPKEAKEFFNWFIGGMDNRIEILKQIVKEDGLNIKFDYSPESLIPLWEWYETKIKYIEKNEEEYKKDFEGRSDWMIPYVSKEKLSYETFNYGVDASMYVARIFENNSNAN